MKGLVHVYTGEGKGKTTAALGLALRAAGCGRRVLLVQFFKGRDSGELRSLALIPNITVRRLEHDFGFFKTMCDSDKQAVRTCHDALLTDAVNQTMQGLFDMVILDEITSAYHYNAVSHEQLHDFLDHKPETLELVLTGRDVPSAFLERADYVTEMCKRKHPFDHGISAREGIEY